MTPWKVLNSDDIESIHQATLHVLSEVGIILSHQEFREKLVDAGASIKEERVLLPPEMVESAIESCGKTVTIRGRNEQTANLGDGTLHWHNVGGARDVYDPRSGKSRRATIQDVRDSTRCNVSIRSTKYD